MAELINGDYFDGQTKLRYNNKVLNLFRFFFVRTGKLTEEESKRLVCERDDACLNFRVRESCTYIRPNDFCFNGVCNRKESRRMFKITSPTFKLLKDKGNRPNFDELDIDAQLNLGQVASASSASKLPEPALNQRNDKGNISVSGDCPVASDEFKFELTMDVDKLLQLVIHDSDKRIQGKNTRSIKFKCKKNTNGLYHIKLKEQIKFGAEKLKIKMIYLTNYQLQVKTLTVLKITNAKCFKYEIYSRGQTGAYEYKGGKKSKKDKKKVIDTFVRYIQCGKAIFKIDFYDFYIYEIVGIECDPDPDKSLPSQWPWVNSSGTPIVPPLNKKKKYKDLIDSVNSEDARAEFVKIFKLLNTGNFCNFTSNNKSVMQLCLALSFSEVIRNFKCIEWNKLLISCLDLIKTDRLLRKVLKLHPMVSGGSFEKRLTGYNGGTDAADCKVSSFETVLKQLWPT
ncbi:hypothetical protein ACF0H5_011877 [Mactra antiquata]